MYTQITVCSALSKLQSNCEMEERKSFALHKCTYDITVVQASPQFINAVTYRGRRRVVNQSSQRVSSNSSSISWPTTPRLTTTDQRRRTYDRDYDTTLTIVSRNVGFFWSIPVRLSTVGNRAFPVAEPRVWNTLPEDITTSQSLSAFCQRPKTWLFRKSYPDIII